MKVMQLTTGFDINYPGGITNYVRNLHASLQSKDIDSIIVSSETKGDFEKLISQNYFHPVKTLNRFPQIPPTRLIGDTKLLEFIETSECDIIHVHTVYGLSQKVIRHLITSDTPYIVSLHDYYLGCPRIYMIDNEDNPCRTINLEKCGMCTNAIYNNNLLKLIALKLNLTIPHIRNHKQINSRHLLMADFLKHAKMILPVSERVKEIFENAYPDANYNALNIGNESADSFIKKSHSGNTTAAFLGTMNKHKGAELFIKIVEATKDSPINFEFYGRGEEVYLDRLASLGVKIKGSYKPSNLPQILNHIDLGIVLPIWEDNGPQVVMELINNGIPVFATKVGGIPDFVKHLSTGFLFHPDSDIEINSAIKWLQGLTNVDINRLMANISPLKSNESHSNELIKIYQKSIMKAHEQT